MWNELRDELRIRRLRLPEVHLDLGKGLFVNKYLNI
jgi:hypothetical protein